MKVQQIAVYESLKDFMLAIGYAQATEQRLDDPVWSTLNENNFRAMMEYQFGVEPRHISVPTTLAQVHERIKVHKAWKYREELEYDEGDEAPAVAAPSTPPTNEFQALLGSSVQPSILYTVDGEVTLGEVVCAAHTKSGLTVEAWNALPDAEREDLIAAQCLEMGAYPMKPDSGQPPPPTPTPTPTPPPAAPEVVAEITKEFDENADKDLGDSQPGEGVDGPAEEQPQQEPPAQEGSSEQE
jgi:hypothetical protein